MTIYHLAAIALLVITLVAMNVHERCAARWNKSHDNLDRLRKQMRRM